MKNLIAAGFVAMMAVPAFAADWTGGYVGLGIGTADIDGPGNVDGNDTSYGIHAGYDYDFGDWVIGGELEYDRTKVDLGNGAALVDNVGRFKVKGGYDFGTVMGYVVVGAARADTSLGSDNGGLAGIGLAWGASDMLTFSAEALRHEFKDIGGTGVDAKANTFNLRASFRF